MGITWITWTRGENFFPMIKKNDALICIDPLKGTAALKLGKVYPAASDSYLGLGGVEVVQIIDEFGKLFEFRVTRFEKYKL